MKKILSLAVMSLASAIAACGGGGGGGSTTQPPSTTIPGAPVNVIAVAGNASASVSFTAPLNNGGAVITSYTATSNPSAITASGISSPITVSGLTNGVSYTFTVFATNSAGAGPASAASAAVTPVLSNPTITSITPAVKWCVGQCGIFPIILTGTNFVAGQTVTCTPDPDIQSVTLVSSTQLNVEIAMDGYHMGSGYRSCKVCNSGGGCSATAQFGLYGQNSATVTPSGQKLVINSAETISGLRGYADEFSAGTGAPNGTHCPVGAAAAIASDNLTGFWTTGGNPYTNTCQISTSVPGLAGGSWQGVAAIKVDNSYVVAITSAAHKMGCVNWIGPAFTNNTPVYGDAGTNPQSLALGVTSGKTYAYVFDAGGQTLYKLDASNCSSQLNWPVTGVTAGAPSGTEIVLFDSLGLGMLVSYGDNLAIVFNESTLKSTGTISVPKVPVSMIAVGNVAVVGNFDGTFTRLDPLVAATTIPSATASFMPVGLVPAVAADGTGVDFYACPQDGVSSCSSFKLP